MSLSYTEKKNIRNDCSKYPTSVAIPNLIEIQKHSWNSFIYGNESKNEQPGIDKEFALAFPIEANNIRVEYLGYRLGDFEYNSKDQSYKYNNAEYNIEDYIIKSDYDINNECIKRRTSYTQPLKVKFRITNLKTQVVKEEEIYMNDIYMMTSRGTFIINSVERVLVCQLHRSPGLFCIKDRNNGAYITRIIPDKGSWLDFEISATNGRVYTRINTRKKFYATLMLGALGMNTEEILETFHEIVEVNFNDKGVALNFNIDDLVGKLFKFPILDPKTKKEIIKAGVVISKKDLESLKKAKVTEIFTDDENLESMILAKTIEAKDKNNKSVILNSNKYLDIENIKKIRDLGIKKIFIAYVDELNYGHFIHNTLQESNHVVNEEARKEIFKIMNVNEPISVQRSDEYFEYLCFNDKRYTLSETGRFVFNKVIDDLHNVYPKSMQITLDSNSRNKLYLSKEDIIFAIRNLISVRLGKREIDDIDHLGNRRVKTVGKMLERQFNLGLVRMTNRMREDINKFNDDDIIVKKLINPKPLNAVIREFLLMGQLSQFMDQTNPLSEITHRRRVSALGVGGVKRERAGAELRDVHPAHYGRLCPVETPEGSNIGLINSLSIYASINEYGFITSCYHKIENGKIKTDKVYFFNAFEEEQYKIAQFNVARDKNNNILEDTLRARFNKEICLVSKEDLDYIDIAPETIISLSASLIPFLEHNDANRALMGSNMQRQAIPLLKTEAPLIGTGIEKYVVRDSGVCVKVRRSGVVESIYGDKVVVKVDKSQLKSNKDIDVDIYQLIKYSCSNQNTCVNQKVIFKVGDKVNKGDILADGPAMKNGELALGKNVRIAFMPWRGSNFEDSVLISNKLVSNDAFTTIHIKEFICYAYRYDNKLGEDEITSDLPYVSEEDKKHLDKHGIVNIGTWVKQGDILVGKLTPKGESKQKSAEEELLFAIFDTNVETRKNTSLKLEENIEGVVIDVQALTREEDYADDTNICEIINNQIKKYKEQLNEDYDLLENACIAKLKNNLNKAEYKTKSSKSYKKFTDRELSELTLDKLDKLEFKDKTIKELVQNFRDILANCRKYHTQKVLEEEKSIKKNLDLPAGVTKCIKVSIALKRKIQVGDKIASRHGNKGVISTINPVEDMPFDKDGIPVDMVLNPLGVPSRMNIGQVLESHLGLAAFNIGSKINDLWYKYKSKEGAKKMLIESYKKFGISQNLDDLNNKELEDLIDSLKNGMLIKSQVFNSTSEEGLKDILEYAGQDTFKMNLYDGLTGEPFDNKVTVGYLYVMKLNHMVEDKMHARSIGPYSLITQQPLGGKNQLGGQRLGEMEVWALEAYGAAYLLQEMLTLKSDDIKGRDKAYNKIVYQGGFSLIDDINIIKSKKDDSDKATSLPASFRVLQSELQSLAINLEIKDQED